MTDKGSLDVAKYALGEADAAAGPSGPLRWLIMLLGASGVLLAVNQQFLLNVFGFQPLGNAYLYYLIGIFLAVAFLSVPMKAGPSMGPIWLNSGLAVLALGNMKPP